jgi:hypothetical protein
MTYIEREFIRIRALKVGQLNLSSTDHPIGGNIHEPASPVRGALMGGFQARERGKGSSGSSDTSEPLRTLKKQEAVA